MVNTESYQLVREIKLAVYRASNYGDQIRIWMNERTPSIVQFEVSGEMPTPEFELIKSIIEASSAKLKMQTKQNVRPMIAPAKDARLLQPA